MVWMEAMEEKERQHLLAYERWDHQVLAEMVMVHYVTFVLKPLMDELRVDERDHRYSVQYEEEQQRYSLTHESPVSLAIAEERKAMKMRELQLLRIAGEQRKALAAGKKKTYATRGGSGGAAAATGTAGGAGWLPPVEHVPPGMADQLEARQLLRQYIDQRHGAQITAVASQQTLRPDRAVTTPSLPLVSPLPAPRRNVVGIANYISLLDLYMRERDQWIHAEQASRRDIGQLFFEEQQVVLEWQRKRMHLERLLYWRQQREVAMQAEVAHATAVPRKSDPDPKLLLLLEMLEEGEESDRDTLVGEEQAALLDLRRTWMEMSLLRRRTALTAEANATMKHEVWLCEDGERRQLLFQAEQDVRRLKEKEFLVQLQAACAANTHDLRELFSVSTDEAKYNATLVLQRAFRRSLSHELGWRATHRDLGRGFRLVRDERCIEAGRKSLGRFKAKLQAEEAALMAEEKAVFIQRQQAIAAMETKHRLSFLSSEQLDRTVMVRQHQRVVGMLFAPRFIALAEAAVTKAMEVEVAEEMERETIVAVRHHLTSIITAKRTCRHEERSGRRAVVLSEREAWSELLASIKDRCEEIRIAAEEEDQRRRAAVEAFAASSLQRVVEFSKYLVERHQGVILDIQVELLACAESDDTTREDILSEEEAALRVLWESWALEAALIERQVELSAHCTALQLAHQQATVIDELERRSAILQEEHAALDALLPQLSKLLEGPLRCAIERRCAVNAIGTWYTAVKAGHIGRAATNAYLRETLGQVREERAYEAKRLSHRLHVHQVRAELERTLTEMRRERVAVFSDGVAILVSREEPRERAGIEGMQEMIFGVLLRNAEADRDLVNRALLDREAVLWQEESYGRADIQREWMQFCRGQLTVAGRHLDPHYFARLLQRWWRGCLPRLQYWRMVVGQQKRFMALESMERAGVEAAALTESALVFAKPLMETQLLHCYHSMILPNLLYQWCRDLFHDLMREEAEERGNLLWEARYDLCDNYLMTREAVERKQLHLECFHFLHQETRLVSAEAEERVLLVHERTNFLLRLLLREERVCRRSVEVEEDGETDNFLQMPKSSLEAPET